MIKRTVAITKPYHLSCRNAQLFLSDKETKEEVSRSIEDLGCLIMEHPHITFTQALIRTLSAHNVSVIFCDEKYHPTALLLHLDTHYVQQERFRYQVNASQPLELV
mgnify:CR=1 FL=1